MICKKQIRDYTKGAKDYDLKRYTEKDDRFVDLIRREKVKKLLKPNKSMKILDVGTGTGSGVIFFAKDVKEITGLDATKAMLVEAEKKIKKKNLENVKLIHANALKMPFKDEEFDAVICLNFLHLFTPFEKQMPFLKEMERVVKKKGKVIVEIDNLLKYKDLGNDIRDLYRLDGSLKVRKVIGTTLTKTKKIFWINKSLAHLYSRLANVYPFKLYSHRFIVSMEKLAK